MEYVRILHLAATTMEATVDSALSLLTRSGQPDLKIYDRLLTVSLAAAGVCG